MSLLLSCRWAPALRPLVACRLAPSSVAAPRLFSTAEAVADAAVEAPGPRRKYKSSFKRCVGLLRRCWVLRRGL